MNVDLAGFLWSEEKKLVHFFILMHEMAFAWTEEEKGAFYEALFPAVKMPVVEHYPWAEKPIPVPPGIRPEVFKYLKKKIASGVYEPSNSSYRTAWFCVPKQNGKIRLVHNLQLLNRVTICDSATPPYTEQLVESFGGHTCYATLDLFVAFDQQKLDERSRDLMTFNMPLGMFRLTTIPMGWTNSFQVMQGDVSFILRNEIPEFTIPYVE